VSCYSLFGHIERFFLMVDFAKPSCQRGLSLVEFLIAGALGVFLLAAVVLTFSDLRDNNRMLRSVSDLQEIGWAAIRLMERDIQMAAFGGCATGPNAVFSNVASDGPVSNLYEEAVRGYTVMSNGKWDSGAGSAVDPHAGVTAQVVGSDVITIVRASNASAGVLEGRMEDFDDPIIAASGAGITFNDNDLVLVSDCISAEVFEITDADTNDAGELVLEHDDTKNQSDALSKLFNGNAQVRHFSANTYYVGDTGREDASGDPISALYRVSHSGERVELVGGVETLQILYGEKLPGGRIRYSDVTDHSIDWSQVISVRFAMLVSGRERVLIDDDDNTYSLVGISVGPADSGTDVKHPSNRRFRRVFSSTIYIQNKVTSS
jgi:type IV pilus assembly protein PilW